MREMTPEQYLAELEDAVREEQACLWDDLNRARLSAIRGCWSMGCDALVERIVALAVLVGATPWDEIQVGLLRDGIYERVLIEAGIEYPPIDWDRVAAVGACIAGQVQNPT